MGRVALLPLLALLMSEASAKYLVEGADQSHVEVPVSSGEQNRLSIEGRRIAHVVPSHKDALTVLKDETLGALYFALSESEKTKQTVTLFVTDDKGVSYRLILVPKSIAGEEIVLRPPKASYELSRNHGSASLSASYQRRIKDLTLLMADPSDWRMVDKTEINRVVPLWREAQFVLLSEIVSAGLVGEHYRLSNISPSLMRLGEQELYRKNVLSIAVERHVLGPGESTDVFVVRRRGEDE